MPQSNKNELNLRLTFPLIPNQTIDPAIIWEDWSYLFNLDIFANLNIVMNNSLNTEE